MSRIDMIATFGGKYILIGESGTLIHDSLMSPVTGTLMNGVETHAHFLDGLLQKKILTPAGDGIIFLIAIFLTILTSLIYFYIPKYLSPIFAIVITLLTIYVVRYAYDIYRTLFDILPLLLSGSVLTFPMTFIYRFFVVDREKRYIENAFGHYIDPKMVEMIDAEQVSVSL